MVAIVTIFVDLRADVCGTIVSRVSSWRDFLGEVSSLARITSKFPSVSTVRTPSGSFFFFFKAVILLLSAYAATSWSPEKHLPVTNPMIHSASLLSPTFTVTPSLQNSARELTWSRISCGLWYLNFLSYVESLKDKVYKANPHTLEELRNNIRSEIAATSGEL